MKEVAGTLRLTLAQYRELAAFSQFASDLDEATQRQLRKGARLTEVLKQGQYTPLPAENQVIQLLAGNEGVYNDLEIEQVGPFSDALVQHFLSSHADLMTEMVEKGTLKKDDLKKRLLDVIHAFKSTWH